MRYYPTAHIAPRQQPDKHYSFHPNLPNTLTFSFCANLQKTGCKYFMIKQAPLP